MWIHFRIHSHDILLNESNAGRSIAHGIFAKIHIHRSGFQL